MEAAIFDMDGLLLDSERISMGVWSDVCCTAVPSLDRSLFQRMVGHKWEDCLQMLQQAMPGQEELALSLAQTAHERYKELVAVQPIPLKHGVVAILDHLRSAGIPRAVATSTMRPLALRKLHNAGLTDYFSAVAGGDEVPHGKPSPDIYLLAAKRLGADPRRCIAFEDSGPGIRAAHAAGMIPILVPDMHPPEAVIAENLPFVVLRSIDEAIALLPPVK